MIVLLFFHREYYFLVFLPIHPMPPPPKKLVFIESRHYVNIRFFFTKYLNHDQLLFDINRADKVTEEMYLLQSKNRQ